MPGLTDLQPSLMDLLGIIIILVVVFGASVLPRTGEWVGRRIARAKGLPLPERRGKAAPSARQ